MHPAVVKAQQIGRIANQHDWKGQLHSEMIDGVRVTNLEMARNDECFVIEYHGQKLSHATYSIFDSITAITSKSQMLGFLTGWPNLIRLFEQFPNMNHPLLVQKYRRLPFDWREDDEDTIINSLLGKRVWWYNPTAAKIYSVRLISKRTKAFRINPVGHRKLFFGVEEEVGFCNFLLDSLIQVRD